MSDNAFVHVRDLRVVFRRDGQTINAVNGVSFEVQKGEVMALIGESGSGKSVTLRALMRLHPPGSSELSGTLQVGDDEVLTMSASQLRRYRGGRCAMIFQEPLLAFDPVYTVGQQIIEGLRRHEGLSRQAARDRALEALRQVRIPSPERRLDAYPHEMSGGMRQRAMIALALSCNPQLLLADEPTTALDATVQIQILILLREQQKQRGLSIVFVTHDIGAAVEIADRVAVMYAGRIVEEASMSEILIPRCCWAVGRKRGLRKVMPCTAFPARRRIWRACRPAALLPSAARTVARSVSRVCRRRNPSRNATR